MTESKPKLKYSGKYIVEHDAGRRCYWVMDPAGVVRDLLTIERVVAFVKAEEKKNCTFGNVAEVEWRGQAAKNKAMYDSRTPLTEIGF